jgi:hypothetical protein
MHDAPHAQPRTQQSPSVVTPPGQRADPLGLGDVCDPDGRAQAKVSRPSGTKRSRRRIG